MQAAVRTEYGGRVHLAEVPVPEIGPDQVLIDVRAAGVDRGVLHLAEGTPYALRLVFGLRRPKQPVLGLDLAGTVAAVGAEVTRFAPGDEVLGIGTGSFAGQAVALERKLVRKPAGLDWAEAAALPVSGLTALQAVEAAGVGERVMILGASGGVGTYAVQLAGGHVIGVCSAGKAERVRELGAAEVVDYAGDLPGDVDVILAIGGNASVREMRRLLTPKGTLLVIGGEGGGRILGIGRQLRAVALNPLVKQRLGMLVSKESGDDLQRLVDLVDAGRVRPVVGARYPLEQAEQALADMAAGRVFGKAVLEVS
jgi:NADPH:quinone reductase-like Zn-dependent oxidoreductase